MRSKFTLTKRLKSAKAARADRRDWWTVLNSPFVLVILSTVVIGSGAKLYSDHQDAVKDQETRRSSLSKHLTEFEHRLASLQDADEQLNHLLGSEDHPRTINPRDVRLREELGRVSAEVSRLEWDVMTGRGSYLPTSPEYGGVNLEIIAYQIDQAAGIPELELGAWTFVRIFDRPPPNTWISVRSELPKLVDFSFNRRLLYLRGELPLIRGRALSSDQETELGRDLKTLERQSDEAHNRLERVISDMSD